VAILVIALSTSRVGAQVPAQRDVAYKGCYRLAVVPPAQPNALGLPRQIEFTIDPRKDANGRLWDFSTPPAWRSVRIIQPTEPDVYGAWGWRVIRQGHIEMSWVAHGGPAGTVDIELDGTPKALVGTAKYTSDDFSGSPAVSIRADRIDRLSDAPPKVANAAEQCVAADEARLELSLAADLSVGPT
jgi:hypothetical protein